LSPGAPRLRASQSTYFVACAFPLPAGMTEPHCLQKVASGSFDVATRCADATLDVLCRWRARSLATRAPPGDVRDRKFLGLRPRRRDLLVQLAHDGLRFLPVATGNRVVVRVVNFSDRVLALQILQGAQDAVFVLDDCRRSSALRCRPLESRRKRRVAAQCPQTGPK
jgi:hypothetical protein